MCWEEFTIHNLHVEYRRRGMPPRIGIKTIEIPSVNKGAIVLVKGDNGCGKTTLIRALAGEIQISSGALMLDDLPLTPEEFREKCCVSYVPQSPSNGAVDSMTVEENILVRFTLHNGKKTKLSTLLTQLKLDNNIQNLPCFEFLTKQKLSGDMRALSGGQLQAVNLLSSMLSCPDFLLMDEPTSSISNSRIEKFWELFLKIKSNNLVTFITSHQDPYIEQYANVVVNIKDGVVQDIKRLNAA